MQLLFNALTLVSLWMVATLGHANEEILKLVQDGRYWSYAGGNYNNWHYSRLSQINNKNIGRLRVAWSINTGSLQGHAGGPLVLPAGESGTGSPSLYIHIPFPDNVLAVNLENLRFNWIYASDQPVSSMHQQCCGYRNLGLAYAAGRLYLGQADNRLVALEARTGNRLWSTGDDGGSADPRLVTPLPHPVKNHILAVFNTLNRSGIAAYRVSNGSPVWRAFNNGADTETLFDARTRIIGGRPSGGEGMQAMAFGYDPFAGTVGTGMIAWDPGENLIYYPGITPATRDGSGRELFEIVLYARDADTGIARWAYRLTPDAGSVYRNPGRVVLADIPVEGSPIPAVVHFSSNGFVYIVNRVNGDLIQARKFDPSVNWASTINLDTGRPVLYEEEGGSQDIVCPSIIGARGDEPEAFSPHTGLFYVPVRHACTGYRLVRGQQDAGDLQAALEVDAFLLPAGTVMKDGTTHMGALTAWDVSRGRAAWSVREQWPVMSGVLVTAGDAVFYGTLDGYLKAVDARTGKNLWQFKVPSGVIGNIITWSYKDKQFIGVLSGVGDVTELLGGDKTLNVPVRTGGTLMVFSLP